MQLLFITRKFPPSVGGMEIYSQEIHRAMMRSEEVDVTLFAPRTAILGRPSLTRMIAFFASACAHLWRHRHEYDAVLIGDFAIASLASITRLFSGKGTRIGVALHGQDVYFLRRRSPSALLYRAIARLVIASNAIDVAIANSHAIRDEANSHGIRNVTVIPLATTLPDVSSMKRAHPPRLLFAGRLIRYKGLSWFIEHVWPHLDPRLELHVAGEVWDDEEAASLESAPRIHYLGKVDHQDLPALRSSAIACIMPNRPPAPGEQDEGFGLSALESAAAGTPIVAARTGGLPDAIVDGITGFLVEPMDAAAWVSCLQGILGWSDGERDDFAARARSEIERAYNWDLVARRTLACLQPNRDTQPRAAST